MAFDEKDLTIERSMADFKKAYGAKRALIEAQHDDFKFALGKQWSDEDVSTLAKSGIKAVTDNRIQPNIFLLTGLERQNRTEFRAFPEGEEDGVKAEIASSLFKHSIKTSDFAFKSSDQFKDGITCGESHLELYLDYTDNIINGKPCWKKVDADCLFPEPGSREYDFSDARYVYKITKGLCKEDLISLFPEKAEFIENRDGGTLSFDTIQDGAQTHVQKKDYPTTGGGSWEEEENGFDLVERYYKKWVEKTFIADKETGELKEAADNEKALAFVQDYQAGIAQEQADYQAMLLQAQAQDQMALAQGIQLESPPPAPPRQKDPDRFVTMTKKQPEIWVFSHVPGIDEPLADERAWFYPKWKQYPFIPYFARFSTAPLSGDDRVYLVQGIARPVKNLQEKHNKSETLMLRHLNTATNSGWLAEEDSWVDRDLVKQFGSSPGINLEYKTGKQPPTRIFPMPLSAGHANISEQSAEAIKADLGINADLLSVQEGGQSSGRAIALRQRQGMLMIQELFDNLSRTRAIGGKFLLSQLGEIYDTETAKKVLGEAFLTKNFPPPTVLEPQTGPDGMPVPGSEQEVPMKDEMGMPMQYDKELAEVSIAEVLSGNLGEYDVTVSESVASETMKLANMAELKEFSQSFPGLVPPTLLIEESQLPKSTKDKILSSIEQAQAAQAQAQQMAGPGPMPQAG